MAISKRGRARRIRARGQGKRILSIGSLDPRADAIRAVPEPKRCDEDNWRLMGTKIARAMGHPALETAFGARRLWRKVTERLDALDRKEALLFLRLFLEKANVPHARALADFCDDCLDLELLTMPVYIVAAARSMEKDPQSVWDEKIRVQVGHAECVLRNLITGARGERSGLFWSAVSIVGDPKVADDLAYDAGWEDTDHASGIIVRPIYAQGYAYAWNAVKMLIGHIVRLRLAHFARTTGSDSPKGQIARAMRDDVRMILYCAAGGIMAGYLTCDGDGPHLNPFLALARVCRLGAWPIGVVPDDDDEAAEREIFCVYRPPLS